MTMTPNRTKLLKRDLLTFLTISLVVVLAVGLLQLLIVGLDDEVDHHTFITFVWPWALGALLILWTLGLWLNWLWIRSLSYSVAEDRVVIYKGFITKKQVNIPYRAVTDFTLSRSLYERWLSIGTLQVQTAGQSAQGGGFEGKLEGLVDYEQLHADLRARVQEYRSTEKAGVDEAPTTDAQVLADILDELRRIRRQLIK